MRCLRRVITTWIHRYPSPGRFEPRARADSLMRFSFLPAATVRYPIGIDAATAPLRFHGTAKAQGCVVSQTEGSGGQRERRRIGEYPQFHLHVCHPSQQRARATVSHFLTWLPALACTFVALAGYTYHLPVGGALATASVRSPSAPAPAFTNPLPDSVSASYPPTADPVRPAAQVVRASSLDWASLQIAHAEQVWIWESAGPAR